MSNEDDKSSTEEAAMAEPTGQDNAQAAGVGESFDTTTPDSADVDAGAGQGAQPEGPLDPQSGEEEAPLERQLADARRQTAENWDRFVRLQAEFENFKKRIGKEHSERLKYALAPLLQDLLGVVDNLERAMQAARDDPARSGDSLLSGIEMVMKQLQEALERHGVTRIEANGRPFDPNLHEALAMVETDEIEENHVVQELQPGYLLNGRVVRPARVAVAKATGTAES